jgi:hypothetical protein
MPMSPCLKMAADFNLLGPKNGLDFGVHFPLPIDSGVRLALLLRDMSSDLSIVLTSGCPQNVWNDQDIGDLRRIGSRSVAFLQKPFLPAELLKIVDRLLQPPSAITQGPCAVRA